MRFSLLILSVLLGIASYSPLGWYPLVFIYPALFFYFLLREKRIGRMLAGSFFFRLALISGVTFYVFDPLLAILKTLPFLGLPLLIFFIKRRFPNLSQKSLIPVIALGYLFFDHLPQKILLPSFVTSLGTALGASPFLGLAKFGGLWGLGFFAVLVNGFVLWWYLAEKRLALKIVPALALMLAAGFLLSYAALYANRKSYLARPAILRLAAVSVDERFDEFIDPTPNDVSGPGAEYVKGLIEQRFDELRRDLEKMRPLDLVVFPEDLMDTELWNHKNEEAFGKYGITNAGFVIDGYRKIAAALESNVAANFTTIRNGKRYNSEIIFDRRGEIKGIYDKVDLALSGEYWPFGNWIPFYIKWLAALEFDPEAAIFNPAYRYQSGKEKNILLVDEGVKIGTLICVEIHHPDRASDFIRRGANFLINSSSNSWVKIGLENYLAQTQMLRKIESVWLATPIVVTGKKDYAGVIFPDGSSNLLDFRSSKGYVIWKGLLK